MGTIHHHALIVTSWDAGLMRDAHRLAKEWGGHPTEIISAANNGFESFAVLPDGSKEGWSASDQGDALRDALIVWINGQAYEDGSNRLQWAEVSFGGLPATVRTNARAAAE